MTNEWDKIEESAATVRLPAQPGSIEASRNREVNKLALMEKDIDISGIDKAELLAALHNGTKAIGMGVMQDIGRDLTVEEARHIISKRSAPHCYYFDYFLGRPLKCDISGDAFDPRLYDRDAGVGKAAEIVSKLRG